MHPGQGGGEAVRPGPAMVGSRRDGRNTAASGQDAAEDIAVVEIDCEAAAERGGDEAGIVGIVQEQTGRTLG